MLFSSCCSCATCGSLAAFFGASAEAEALFVEEGWFADAVAAGWFVDEALLDDDGWFAEAVTAGWFVDACCFDLSDASDECWPANAADTDMASAQSAIWGSFICEFLSWLLVTCGKELLRLPPESR